MKKTAIVTGGSRGIGFAIAKQLASDGFNLSIFDVHEQTAYADQLAQLTEAGADWIYVRGDLSAAADRERLVAQTTARLGGVHVLVNNAGVGPRVRADLLDMTEESYDFVMGINTKGTLFLTQAVARQMLKQEITGGKRGTIINISSCSSVVSSPNRGEYCISKAGISMITLLFADRLAGDGIFVHEIRPGVIATDMTSVVKEKYDAMIAGGVFPVARWGMPEDIARAASVFAGDTFLYTTGNFIDVDGGFHIRRL